MTSEDEENFDLDSIFEEPPRPPTPEPTVATYTRDKDNVSSTDDWQDIKIRLVGSHPLWAHYLWNAALALASYLDTNRIIYANRCVLELGAGGALPSIVTAKNGAQKVVITDYPDAALIDNIRHNVSENLEQVKLANVNVQGYIWGHPVNVLQDILPTTNQPGKYHLIILSDLIFNHSQHEALLKTCEFVLAERSSKDQGNEPRVLVFYSHHRPHLAHRDMAFFTKAQDRGWLCEKILTRIFPPMFPEDSGEESIRSTVHGWKLTRKVAE